MIWNRKAGTGKTFMLRIDIPALIAFLLFAGLIFLYLIPGFEKAVMDRKREMIREVTSTAYSILEYYHSRQVSGETDSTTAKLQASAAIGQVRYGASLKDYFWITDLHPVMIVHPYRPELNGRDLTDFSDASGKKVFVDFVRSVGNGGEGYVSYMWQWNDDSSRTVPKLSYVRLFEPWGWVIGTGIYIDDVRTEIRRIEYRALIISAIIAVVIIGLLVLISIQSHKIEKKRTIAETELHKSRELYKALAGASKEGVLIWSEQGLQGNKVLLSWLGFSEDELLRIPLSDLLQQSDLKYPTSPVILFDTLDSALYTDAAIRTKKGTSLKVHADFSKILMGGSKAIMAVLRPVPSSRETVDNYFPGIVLDGAAAGFFTIAPGRKNRFDYVSRSLSEMLGFADRNELRQISLNSLFGRKEHMESFVRHISDDKHIIRKEVLLRKKNGELFWALLNAAPGESEDGEKQLKGTIEKLTISGSDQDSPYPDIGTYSSAFIMKAPVRLFMTQPLVISSSMQVSEAAREMQQDKAAVAVVTGPDGRAAGIIEYSGACTVLSDKPDSGLEVAAITDPEINFVGPDAPVEEALRLMNAGAARAVLVITEYNDITGILTATELIKPFFTAPGLLERGIAKAGGSTELFEIFRGCQMITTSMILGKADPVAVTGFISHIADSICRRVIEICLSDASPAPCNFAFIQTGSAGRMEQTLCTDQDNGIIFENTGNEQQEKAEAYFLDLAKRINKMLGESGYSSCKGGNMASNPKWCRPLDSWKAYFAEWIRNPGPDELLDISIFFDIRHCYGDSSLTDGLKDFISKDLRATDIFFHHMAVGWKEYLKGVHLAPDRKTDIKKIMMPLTGLIRLYSLKYSIGPTSTTERIIALGEGGFLPADLMKDAVSAAGDLTTLRLWNQAECAARGEYPDNTIDFGIKHHELFSFAEQALSVVRNLMLQADADFHTSGY